MYLLDEWKLEKNKKILFSQHENKIIVNRQNARETFSISEFLPIKIFQKTPRS